MSILHRTIRSFLLTLWLCVVLGLEHNSVTGPENAKLSSLTIRYPRASMKRLQPRYPPEMPFPCRPPDSGSGQRFPVRASSVHALRPSDISVVGAMGDSLVAANGAMEEWALGTFFEYRGVSWCAGGDSTWREIMSLPNILKEFNPRVTGFSTGFGEYRAPNSHMNVAFPVSSAMDALLQAKILVNRMKKDSKVNFKEDWKVITILFGANDACSLECFSKDYASPAAFVKNLQKALDYLQDNLPRTFVNLASVIDVTTSVRVKRTTMCHFLHRMFCQCFHKGNYDHVSYLGNLALKYQRVTEDLVNSGRYDKKDDFTVVTQPFLKLFNLPKVRGPQLDQVIEQSYVTHDCFHFSQKGHALAANLLWNNMLEPVGNKTTTNMDYIMQTFRCPTERAPYFFTAKNTKKFFATGFQ